jgi:hypothetical protein
LRVQVPSGVPNKGSPAGAGLRFQTSACKVQSLGGLPNVGCRDPLRNGKPT